MSHAEGKIQLSFYLFSRRYYKILFCDKVIKDHVARKRREKTYYKDRVGSWVVTLLLFPDVMFVLFWLLRTYIYYIMIFSHSIGICNFVFFYWKKASMVNRGRKSRKIECWALLTLGSPRKLWKAHCQTHCIWGRNKSLSCLNDHYFGFSVTSHQTESDLLCPLTQQFCFQEFILQMDWHIYKRMHGQGHSL